MAAVLTMSIFPFMLSDLKGNDCAVIVINSWIESTSATVVMKLHESWPNSEDNFNICMMKCLLLVTLCILFVEWFPFPLYAWDRLHHLIWHSLSLPFNYLGTKLLILTN